MTDTGPAFRSARNGYDTAQVAAYVADLARRLDAAQYEVSELTRLRDSLKAENEGYKQKFRLRYGGLGDRIEQILTLAEEEAADMRADAAAEVEGAKAQVEKWAADILEGAKRDADRIRREAEGAARARREEAEAHFEAVKADAGRLAAEMETTLAARRKQAEQEYEQRLADLTREEARAEDHAAQLHAEAKQVMAEAERKARSKLEEAERKAAETLEETQAAAERIRADADREVAAAIARRDSIDAQLTHLRSAFGALGSLVPGLAMVDNGGAVRAVRGETETAASHDNATGAGAPDPAADTSETPPPTGTPPTAGTAVE